MASLQLQAYLRDRASDVPLVIAADRHGLTHLEAKLTDKAVAAGEISIPEPVKEEIMSEPNVAADQLRLFIERIERLEEEKSGVAEDIRDVYAEAKSNGYDTKTMRGIVRLRRMEKHARDEADALLETYRNALGLH